MGDGLIAVMICTCMQAAAGCRQVRCRVLAQVGSQRWVKDVTRTIDERENAYIQLMKYKRNEEESDAGSGRIFQ